MLPRVRGGTDASKQGLTLQVAEDCVAMAHAVMKHGNGKRQPRTGKNLPDAAYAELRLARYMATWVTEQIKVDNAYWPGMWNWVGYADKKALAEFADGLPMDMKTMNAIAASYANHRIGPGAPQQTRPGGPAGTIRDFWAQHVGGVVAASGTDRVTLENYARKHEIGVLQVDAPHYYFQMYGTGANQTWHAAWTSQAVAHGLPPVGRQGADERLTVVVRPG